MFTVSRTLPAALFGAWLVFSSSTAWSSAPPNVLVILTDDMRWDAMSCAGHPFLKTPNIDRLANEGARFANAFVTTSQVPSLDLTRSPITLLP